LSVIQEDIILPARLSGLNWQGVKYLQNHKSSGVEYRPKRKILNGIIEGDPLLNINELVKGLRHGCTPLIPDFDALKEVQI